jgi:hypothetical protein
LGDLQISDDCSQIRVKGSTHLLNSFRLDEVGQAALADFVKVPAAYAKKCPAEFRAETFKFWCERYEDVAVDLHIAAGELTAITDPSLVTVSNQQVANIVTSVFKGDDKVRVFKDTDNLHVDVISQAHAIEVPNPHQVPFRPLVGDITNAGVRIITRPTQAKNPLVLSYLERLACTNGMTTSQKLGEISIKGITVEEVIEEMEDAARRILSGLDHALEHYAATAAVPVPGSPQAFAHQLAVEYNLSRKILDEVMILINQLPETASVYDVIQAFTAIAGELDYATRNRIQTLGGSLALDTERMIKRCGSCERLLP